MTFLLDKAIEKARTLSAEHQDVVGAMLLALADAEAFERLGQLDDATLAAVREGLEQARRGEFATEHDIESLWGRLDK